MKWLKWFAGIFALILSLLLGVLVYITIVIDPNDYKPQITQLAEQQGIAVEIKGNLAWQFFPNIAIQLGETTVNSSGTSQSRDVPATSFQNASLVLDWRALLKRQIGVRSVIIDGADIRILSKVSSPVGAPPPPIAMPGSKAPTLQGGQQSEATSQGPSSPITLSPATSSPAISTKSSPAMPDTEQQPARLSLAIDRIEISNSRITIGSEGGANQRDFRELSNFSLSGSGISLTGEPFALDASFDYLDPALPGVLNLALQTTALINPTTEQYAAQDAVLTIVAQGKPAVVLRLDMAFNGVQNTLDVPALALTSKNITATAKLSATNITDDPQFVGQIDLPIMTLRRSLNDFGIDITSLPGGAMEQFALKTAFRGSAKQLDLSDLTVTVDGFTAMGSVKLKLSSPKALNVQLTGNELNLNRYIPANKQPRDTKTNKPPTAQTTNDALFAPLFGALGWLDGGNGDLALQLAGLTYDQVQLKSVVLTSQIRKSVVELKKMSANTFGGSFTSSGRLDLGQRQATLSFNQLVKDISVQQAATAFGSKPDITGQLNANVEGTTRGQTLDDMFANLAASGSLQLVQPVLTTMNIERSYCEVAAMVENVEVIEKWPVGTQLNDVNANVRLQGPQIFIDPYTTGLGNLTLRGNGAIDTKAMTFNILAITHLTGDRTSANGCVVKSKRIRDRDIPIRCKDSFAKANANSCRPDGDIVKQLLQSTILERVREKTGLDDQQSEALEGLLEGLFGR